MRILICTLPSDVHAHAVAWCLEQRGHVVQWLYPLDICAGSYWDFDPFKEILKVTRSNVVQEFFTSQFDVFWPRRLPNIFPIEKLENEDERAVAETELEYFVTGVLHSIERTAFTVNPIAATITVNRKINQLTVAKRLGFLIPKTIISNNFTEIKKFLSDAGGEMICKPLKAFLWKRADGALAVAPTTLISDTNLLETVDLTSSPAIYQEVVKKASEIRVTIMGRSVFAWSKTPEDVFKNVDWRFEFQANAIHASHKVPSHLLEKCFELMETMNIVFGCFDFALTTGGDYIFFEVNSAGQFLFGDEFVPSLNQLAAFTQFLESRDKNFSYSPRGDEATFADFLAENDFMQNSSEERALHFGDLSKFHYAKCSKRLAS